MSELSRIGAASEPVEPQQPKPRTEPAQTATADMPTFEVFDGGLGDMDQFIDTDRESRVNRPGADDPDPTTDPDPAKAKKASWYQRMFGNDKGEVTEGPEAMDAEMSDEMYRFTSEAASEFTDSIFSRMNHALHRTGTVADHRAQPDGRNSVRKAWELYLRWRQMVMTPGTYLVFTIFLNYGVNTIFGLFRWVDRCRTFGWHWPWSDSWIPKANAMYREMERTHQQQGPTEPTPQPMDPAPQTTAQQTETEQLKRAAEAWEKCLETGEPFLKGQGFPKTSKEFPELIGKFKDRSAMMSYLNKRSLAGQQKSRAAEKSEQ